MRKDLIIKFYFILFKYIIQFNSKFSIKIRFFLSYFDLYKKFEKNTIKYLFISHFFFAIYLNKCIK